MYTILKSIKILTIYFVVVKDYKILLINPVRLITVKTTVETVNYFVIKEFHGIYLIYSVIVETSTLFMYVYLLYGRHRLAPEQ